jgi:hypothetical protein
MLGPLLLVLSPIQQRLPLPPEVASLECRVPHFKERLTTSDAGARLGLIRELTYFEVRDSVHLPSLYRWLLDDPSPAIRWRALEGLRDHGIVVPKASLPRSVDVPLIGMLDLDNPACLQRFGEIAATDRGPKQGWAVLALGMLQQSDVAPMALSICNSAQPERALVLTSSAPTANPFVHWSAAVALLHLGCREQAMAAFRLLAEAGSSTEDWYRCLAAEQLVRAGETAYLRVLIELAPRRASSSDRGVALLEDLTGEFFTTVTEWQAWWESAGCKRYGSPIVK